MEFIRDYADWFYLIGAVLFILTLRGLSGPKTAIQGNRYGMIAMAIAVFLASINIFGGFAVTARMLEMFKPKQKKKEG